MDQDRVYGRAFAVAYSTYDKEGSIIPGFRNERWFIKVEN